MIITEKRIIDGVSIPRFYGVAWREPVNREVVCYPIPFHLIIRWATHLWQYFKYTYRTSWESEIAKASAEGYREGWESHQKFIDRKIEKIDTESWEK